jgi:hypothetical protein
VDTINTDICIGCNDCLKRFKSKCSDRLMGTLISQRRFKQKKPLHSLLRKKFSGFQYINLLIKVRKNLRLRPKEIYPYHYPEIKQVVPPSGLSLETVSCRMSTILAHGSKGFNLCFHPGINSLAMAQIAITEEEGREALMKAESNDTWKRY